MIVVTELECVSIELSGTVVTARQALKIALHYKKNFAKKVESQDLDESKADKVDKIQSIYQERDSQSKKLLQEFREIMDKMVEEGHLPAHVQ